jgi:cysteine synthase A
VQERFRSLHALVGGTPLLAIRTRIAGREITVCAKHEVMNFTGSIKDRMALHVMETAWRAGELSEGDTIVEATSGNTGIALAAVGRALLHPVRIYMPDWMSRERTLVIQSLGAEIIPVSAEQGGFRGSIEMADDWVAGNANGFRPDQFDNQANVEAHRLTTGPELLAQVRSLGLEPEAFVAGVGTGGTVMGVGAYLREEVDGIRIHPLEPAESPTLRTGKKVGKHRIQGISDEFIPSIVDLSALDSIVDANDGDAILMAQRLASEFGLGVGISSGANFLGALRAGLMLHDRPGGVVVATVFPDSNKKYLSTDLCREEPVRDGYLTPGIELVTCRAIRCEPSARAGAAPV